MSTDLTQWRSLLYLTCRVGGEVERRLTAGGKPPAPSVALSVIIPACNAGALLDRCLTSLAGSDFRNYECLVVDDASGDDTRAVALRHGAKVVSLARRSGPAAARNSGAQQARGEILVFLDADVCVHPDTLARIDAHFHRHPATAALIGSYDEAPADQGFVSQYKNLFHHYVHQKSNHRAWTFWAGCGAVRREAFLTVGGFDERYRRPCVEDIDLGLRLRAAGRRIALDPEVQVTHLKRWTLATLVRTDMLDRGIPWVALMIRHRTMRADLNLRVSHRLSVTLVYTLLVLGLLQQAAAFTAVAGLLLFLNRDLYRFFRAKRGLGFVVGALPLHWLYYFYCGLAVGGGVVAYACQRR